MNRLVIVEGLPCSGKSTASKYIADSIGARYFDEGCGDHPADYEFHAFVKNSELSSFSSEEQAKIRQAAVRRADGYVIPLNGFGGGLFERLVRYKIYDNLPWETEREVMLDKWREFAGVVRPDERYVFNCVLLQNPMCETMMRFGFDIKTSEEYIGSICDIIRPLDPFVVYLRCDDIKNTIKKAAAERGDEWLGAVIDYHCSGAYGKANRLTGFDGYIKALEERQRREMQILHDLNVKYMIADSPAEKQSDLYSAIIRELGNKTQKTKEVVAMFTLPIENGISAVMEQAAKAPLRFESLSLCESWCSAQKREYLLTFDGNALTCCEYYGNWRDDNEREEWLEKRITLTKADYDSLCELFGSIGMRGWLGKSYSNPDVLDGEGFHLELSENGRRSWSGGSNAFPEGYREFIERLRGIFD